MVLLLASCTSIYKQAPNKTKFLAVYVYEVVLFLASSTLMYKQAPKQTYLYLFMFRGWCFQSQLVLRCTNRHQNKPIFSCLCLRGGGLTRILYFGVQTGTKTSQFLVVKVYGMVLLLAPCPSMYKQAPNQTNFLVVYVYGVVLLLASCTSINKQAPNQTNFLVVYVYEVVLLLASCTSVYKQAPKTNLSLVVYVWGSCF